MHLHQGTPLRPLGASLNCRLERSGAKGPFALPADLGDDYNDWLCASTVKAGPVARPRSQAPGRYGGPMRWPLRIR